MDVLTTRRLILRPFTLGDLDALYAYARMPEVGKAAGWKPHDSIEETRIILDRFIRGDEVWALVLRQTNQLIGSIGLHDDLKRPDIDALAVGYVLHPAFWGQGLVPEAVRRVIVYAFDQLKVMILSVYHYPSNNRSRRVIEKCGFIYEGTLRQASQIYDDTILDDVCYSLTRQDYAVIREQLLCSFAADR